MRCEKATLKIRNIKLSLTVDKPIYINSKMLIINPINKVKITIYKHSPYLINVTGIDSYKSFQEIKQILQKTYNFKIIKQNIDSIMLNYKSLKHKKINLNILSRFCHEYKDYTLDFNSELFNAPFLKSKENCGTLILFSTGSVQVMGCKSLLEIKKIIKILNDLFHNYYTFKNNK